jgi:RNA polymerase sigma-70 factor (ECF subfamily)
MASREDFVRFLGQNQRQLWSYIGTLLPSASDVDDVLQETTVVLWNKWDEFDQSRDFLPWAIGIARLQVLRFCREKRSQRQMLSETIMAELAEAAARRHQEKDTLQVRLQLLDGCIAKLSETERCAIEARYLSGLSVKQLATNLQRPLQTVYSILARARVQLSSCVERGLTKTEVN